MRSMTLGLIKVQPATPGFSSRSGCNGIGGCSGSKSSIAQSSWPSLYPLAVSPLFGGGGTQFWRMSASGQLSCSRLDSICSWTANSNVRKEGTTEESAEVDEGTTLTSTGKVFSMRPITLSL